MPCSGRGGGGGGGGSWELGSVGFDTCINGLVYNMIDVYFHVPCYSFTEL